MEEDDEAIRKLMLAKMNLGTYFSELSTSDGNCHISRGKKYTKLFVANKSLPKAARGGYQVL